MPISAILLYEQVRGDLKRLPRTFFFPSIPTFHRPRFTKRLGVFIALIYIRNVYTEARRRVYIYVVRFTCASFTPRYPYLLAKCLHALFVANVHEILMYSRIPLDRRQIAYACDLRVIIRATHENSFLSPPLFSSRRDKGFDL